MQICQKRNKNAFLFLNSKTPLKDNLLCFASVMVSVETKNTTFSLIKGSVFPSTAGYREYWWFPLPRTSWGSMLNMSVSIYYRTCCKEDDFPTGDSNLNGSGEGLGPQITTPSPPDYSHPVNCVQVTRPDCVWVVHIKACLHLPGTSNLWIEWPSRFFVKFARYHLTHNLRS